MNQVATMATDNAPHLDDEQHRELEALLEKHKKCFVNELENRDGRRASAMPQSEWMQKA